MALQYIGLMTFYHQSYWIKSQNDNSGSSSNRTDENNFQVIIDCLVFLFIIHFHYPLYKYLSPYPSSP